MRNSKLAAVILKGIVQTHSLAGQQGALHGSSSQDTVAIAFDNSAFDENVFKHCSTTVSGATSARQRQQLPSATGQALEQNHRLPGHLSCDLSTPHKLRSQQLPTLCSFSPVVAPPRC